MAKKAPVSAVLKFRKEWILDPGPEILGLNRTALTKVNQLKNEFTTRVNEVIKAAQG